MACMAPPLGARGRARPGWSVRRASLLASMVTCLAGCVVDATLKADGSGKLEMTYPLQATSTEALEKRRFTSDHVKVESLKINTDQTAVLNATFDDATKLSTAEGFKTVSVTRTREGSEERLTVKITNPVHAVVKDEGKPGMKISLALPGKVLETNHNGTIAEDRVTWSFTLAEWVKDEVVEMTVRYAAPPSDKAGAAEKPADTPAAK
jgi:hypothetical protein